MYTNQESEDSQFFILPSDFLRYLHQELLKNTHNKDIVGQVMFGLGKSVAMGIFNSDLGAGLKTESLVDVMHLHWAEVGLGMMSVWTGNDQNYIIQVKRSTEANSIGFTGEPSCHFSRGYLVGLAYARNNINYTAVERECICQGHSHCTFDLSRVEG